MDTRIIALNRIQSLVPLQSLNQVREDLSNHGALYGLSGLESRLTTGLDPVGMVAVRETRERIERIASPLGASMESVVDLTHRLFRKEPYRNGTLSPGDYHPHELVWMISALAAQDGQKLDPIGFLDDYWRLNRELETAASYPQLAAEKALAVLLQRLRVQTD